MVHKSIEFLPKLQAIAEHTPAGTPIDGAAVTGTTGPTIGGGAFVICVVDDIPLQV